MLDHGSVDEVDARQPVQLQNGVARLSKQAALATGRQALSVRFLGNPTNRRRSVDLLPRCDSEGQ